MYRFLSDSRDERDHGLREHDASSTKSQMVSLLGLRSRVWLSPKRRNSEDKE